MANPFITTADPMQQTMVDPEAQALQRQKQFAAMLMQNSQQPQGQMIGGHYVAPAWTQQLNAALNPILGAYMMNRADTEQEKLAEKLRLQNAQEAQDIISTMAGKKGQEVYGAGEQGPTKEVVGAVQANPQLALAKALASKGTAGKLLLPSIMEQVVPKDFDLNEGQIRYRKNPDTGAIEVVAKGGEKYHPPVQTDMGDRIRLEYANGKVEFVPKNLSSKDIMQGRFEGWYTGGGMPNVNNFGGSATGGANTVQVPKGDEKYLPKDIPQYVYDPSITPKANMENAAKFSVENQNNVKNAKNSFGVIKEAANILNSNAPSSGRGENIITGAREFFGGGGETSKADAQLKILGTKLTMQQPRFEGPQSDKDTAMYQAAAGDIGNPNIPIATRVASLKTMIDLAKKYYPNGDWDSVDLSGPVIKKNFLGGTVGLGARPLTTEEKKSEQTGGWRVK